MEYEAARTAGAAAADPGSSGDAADAPCDGAVRAELSAYLVSAFGHPARLDYGTGHECSFFVLLFALFKMGALGPSEEHLQAAVLSCTAEYLRVTRSIQTEYLLEPAGSHGVWGLDDYHCLPFYFGACQLIHNGSTRRNGSNGPEDPRKVGRDEEHPPDCVNDDALLEELHPQYLYFGCVRFIKQIKRGAPFAESSPMLHDITGLPTWSKVAAGLLRLFEGEVLDKLPVVQHFVFGEIFKADWEPSAAPRTAPSYTFSPQTADGKGGDAAGTAAAAGATAAVARAAVPAGSFAEHTRAPWAK